MVRKHLEIAETIEGKQILHKRLGGVQEAVLLNGTKIKAMPGTPKALQGFTGTVIVDEVSVSRFPQEDLLSQALSVSSSKTYMKVILVSNADFLGSFVYQFFYSQDTDWVKRRKEFVIDQVDIYDAHQQQLPSSIISIKNTMITSTWKRFYENQFLGTGFGIIERKDINKYIVDDNKFNKDDYMIMGIDPGFSEKGNPTGVVICACNSTRIKVVHADWWHGKDLTWQKNTIQQLAKEYKINKIVIDQGMAGYLLFQEVSKLSGIGKVDGISASQNYQETRWHMIEELINIGRIEFSSDSSDIIIDDICSAVWDDKGRLLIPQRPFADGRKGSIHADSLLALMYVIEDASRKLDRSQNVRRDYNPGVVEPNKMMGGNPDRYKIIGG
jgi:hypothetical protein